MAYNQNPSKPSAVPAWNSNTVDQRLGFALRDKRTTEAISTPMVIPKLGYSYQTYMSHYPTPVVGVSRENLATWARDEVINTIPGILTLDFDPIYALSDPNMRAETADIFTNLWTMMRILNNMTRDFQPQDIQIIMCALMELKMHIANIRRILNIAKTVVNHELNSYYFGEALIKALGFKMDELTLRQNWEKWWQFFNVTILGSLQKVRWFTNDLVPGQDRWAGMCSEIYKDNPAYTDYCQVYMFRPAHFMNMWATWNTETNAYVWSFEKTTYHDTGFSENGAVAFEAYLNKVYNMIRNVFYDDSTATIIATINAIVERNMGDQIKAEFLQFEQLPWEGEAVKLTYDFDTLLAIHNATICNADVREPYQDIENGTLEQNVTIPVADANPLRVQLFPKIVNMPNFGATTADMINATQWTLTNQPYGLATEVVYLRPGSIGTELITGATVWSNQYNQTTGTYNLAANSISTSAFSWGNDVAASLLKAELNIAQRFANFAFAPLIYFCDMSEATFENPGKVEQVLGQMEVMYVADYGTLSNIHKQFVRNFWGYPFDTPESATFATSYQEDKRK